MRRGEEVSKTPRTIHRQGRFCEAEIALDTKCFGVDTVTTNLTNTYSDYLSFREKIHVKRKKYD